MRLFIQIIVIFLIMAVSVSSQEAIYPSGGNIQCTYTISETTLSIVDTLIIHRTLLNNENFNLENLYFSENIPEGLEIVGQNLTINGTDAGYLVSGPVSNYLINGYKSYFWVVGSPNISEGVNGIVNPGDQVDLEIKLISNSPGIFTLPLHSTVFYGNNSGFFSTSGAKEVEFLLSVDISDNTDDIDNKLPNNFTAYAFPNPFNSAVKILYDGLVSAGRELNFTVYNILGKKIFSQAYKTNSNQNQIVWQPDNSVSSGVYFYKLTSGAASYQDKIILLK